MIENKKHLKLKLFLKFLIIFIILFILIIIYSYFIGNSGLKVKEYKVVNKNIPSEFYGLKIVHISDIHYGKYFNKKKLEKVVKKINEINPDIVVFTGDLTSQKISEEDEKDLTEILSKIKVSIAKYAINGDDDDEYKNWERVIKESGFINLNDGYDIIYGKNSKILISGVSTNLSSKKNINEKLKDANKYLETNEVDYKILLIHEPDFIDKIDKQSYDLILSGHSHNGQINLPFIGAIYKPNGSKKYYKNYYKLNKSDLYISSGLGTSIIHLRLFNKPSFNFYRLVNK